MRIWSGLLAAWDEYAMILDMSEIGQGDGAQTLICPVTPWYYRRIGMIAAMLFLFGLYFLYDGAFGYPKQNYWAEVKQHLEAYEDAQKAGGAKLEEWTAKAKSNGWMKEGEAPPNWQAYSVEKGAPIDPKVHSADAIAQQFQFGGAMLLASFFCLGLMLFNRTKKLVGYADRMVMPNGVEVAYSKVTKVDKRGWPVKGFAYVYYKAGEGDAVKRVTVDDLKFGGANLVMDRLLADFKGELIEKVEPPAPSPEPSPTSSGDRPS